VEPGTWAEEVVDDGDRTVVDGEVEFVEPGTGAEEVVDDGDRTVVDGGNDMEVDDGEGTEVDEHVNFTYAPLESRLQPPVAPPRPGK
jgi:hypothetical protein